MEWLNYHHLRYFWAVAREGSLAKASLKLRVSQPSISVQIHELEEALGEKLFHKEGRNNALTEAGEVVLGYADEIFALGADLADALKNRPGARTLRLNVGVADSFPKLVSNELLKPIFEMTRPVHIVCREGKTPDLLALLAAHRLDLILSDEAAPSHVNFQTTSHLLGGTGALVMAGKALATRLKRGFPKSLHNSPAFLPTADTSLRRGVEAWFREHAIQPRIVAEFEDLALMKVMAAEGRGFIALPDVAAGDALEHYGFHPVGAVGGCTIEFYAVTAAKRMPHPAVAEITESARRLLKNFS